MATFYNQPFSNESVSQQWQRYIRNKPLIKNIEDIVQIQTDEYDSIIKQSTKEQAQVIQNSTNAICGTINSGFELLSDDLKDISFEFREIQSELTNISSILDWKLSRLIDNQKFTNLT